MTISFEIIVALLVLVIASFIKQYISRRKYPPGPLGVPFLGERPIRIMKFLFPKLFHKKSEKEYYEDMKKKYGGVWSVDMGGKNVVVFASMDAINEAFVENGKLFSGRPLVESWKIISGDRGIIFVDGDIWYANRQLAIKALRDLGMGKRAIEAQICEEFDELIENIESMSHSPIDSPHIFDKPTSNVITKIVFGERNKSNDPDFNAFTESLKTLAHSNDAHDILEMFSNYIPRKYLRKIFPVLDRYIVSMNKCLEIIAKKCRDRIKIESEFAKPNCIFDFFWRYRYQDTPEVPNDERICNISHSIFDILFGAGDTINNLLSFGCLILGHDKDLQNDLRKEIKFLVDDYKRLSMEMRKSCPKVLSFIDELMRFFPIDTFLHRRVMKDCLFRGYKIHSNDVVYGDIVTISRDPLYFPNPNVFDAYRFLDKSRTKYTQSKAILTFGIGKRVCIGESIAATELFLCLTKMILRFDICLPPETKIKYEEILTGTVGLVYAPLDHQISFNPF